MQSHCGCKFIFPTDSDVMLRVAPIRMGVLKPSRNGQYMLSQKPPQRGLLLVDSTATLDSSEALTSQCDLVLWHHLFGHLNIQRLQAQCAHTVLATPALLGFVKVSYDFCLLHKASVAPRNSSACQKHAHPLINLSSDIWGVVNVPSHDGLRYCLLVIDHHTNFMWVRFLKSEDDACSELESIMLKVCRLHARHRSSSSAFAPILKFDSDSVFEAATTRRMCSHQGVGVHYPATYAHNMLGKAEPPWRTIQNNTSAVMHSMSVPSSMWYCAVNIGVHLSNRTFSRAVGILVGGVSVTLLTCR
jgi:hypothetical protein